MHTSSLERELTTETNRVVQCMSAHCPCGNWIFVGLAGHLRRATDVRFWADLRCPTCIESFSATHDKLELLSVPLFLFERGFCTPAALDYA
jgi:hypothetical protein